MELKIYSIKDQATGQFSQLQLFKTDAEATRYFDDVVNEHKFGNDFQLYYLGFYNLDTGELFSDVTYLKSGVKSNG